MHSLYTPHRLCSLLALLVGALLWTGCDSNSSSMEDAAPGRISYNLTAQSNGGAIPGGVSGTVTFWAVGVNQTLVTLELDDGATGADVSHPAHIHNSESGDIAIYLSPIDGSGGGGTSARLVNRPISELANFDGYVNIHESVSNLDTIVSQGDIGANAEGSEGEGLSLVDNPRTVSYSLSATGNSGRVVPNGIPGTVKVRELTSGMTLVQTSLDVAGATGADVSHPAHIHTSSDGTIEYYLTPIDGSDDAARSSKLVEVSYDALTEFDGYVNVHESVANLGNVVSQGDIGANADGGGDDDGGNGDDDDDGGGY